MKKVVMVLICLVLAVGCTVIEYKPDRERAVYLAAKDATYGLWRFDAVELPDLERAEPYFHALEEALLAESEETLDLSIQDFVYGQIESFGTPSDREIAREIVAAALDDLKLREPGVLADRRRIVALWIIGGVLDGISCAREAAVEAPPT